MNLINIENITKYYTDTPLFENASFTVDEMEKVGIIGINGTGKTTLLKMLIGVETPDKGSITRANHLVIRYLPQNPDFQKETTVLQAVIEGNRTSENEWSLESDAKIMLQRLGIMEYEQKVDALSGGQRKRIALANTLLSKADILVLDEPINGLDPQGIIEMRQLLLDLNQKYGITILVSSHNLDELSRLATHYGFINNGKMVKEISAKRLGKFISQICPH